MSLLLEALKKAEKAKEEAQRQTRGEAAHAATELKLEAEAQAAQDKPHVLTRPELPDISRPLEIVSDEITPPPPSAAPAPSAAPKPRAAADSASATESARGTAKKVFEAKFKEPNPRLPFYITMGVLGAFAVGTVGYFWYQLRPPPALVNANPQPQSGERPAAVAQSAAPAAPGAAPASQNTIPGLPQQGAAPPPAAEPAPQPAPTAATAQPAPAARAAAEPAIRLKPSSRAAPAEPPRAEERKSEVSVSRPTPEVNPRVATAYNAYLAGDLESARRDYQQALRDDPGNRDALMGLAALDVRSGQFQAAEAAYLRLIQADPRDAHAQAALISLRGGRVDPLAAESRIKGLIATEPGAHELYFTLGNQLAQQGRWAEAQQQYFKAFAGDAENADFAFNLAVSLDHLGQPKLALEYYQRAIALAAKRTAGFDPEAARRRAAQLAR